MSDKPAHECFENYPFWMPLTSISLSVAIYALGASIFYRLGSIWAALYLLFCFWTEWRVLAKSCVHCYYYGKVCAFGKGILCAMLYRRKNPEEFNRRKITWLDLLPDFLIALLPMFTGLFLLFREFGWLLLAQIILLILTAFPATGLLRSRWTCRHCRQREQGCPAEQLFQSKKKP